VRSTQSLSAYTSRDTPPQMRVGVRFTWSLSAFSLTETKKREAPCMCATNRSACATSLRFTLPDRD
jgi:hypothetical protein